MADVTMPQLGETVTEGTITRWLKAVGDTVAADEVLFEVSTDKVDSEVPSPAAGVLSEILVPEGETVDVGIKLATIGSADQQTGGSADQQTGGSADQQSGGGAPTPAPAAAPAPAPAPPPSAPAPAPAAPASNGNAAGEVARQEALQQQPPRPAPAPTADGPGFGGKVLSPVVRKLISENGVDPSQINGTGAGGRITREDVETHLAQRGASTAPSYAATTAPAAAAPPARPAPQPPRLPAAAPGQHDTVVPFSNIRRRTAEHMVMSKHTSAHTLVTVEVDFANVDKVRKVVKDKFKQEEGASLTYLPFITRAVVDALREFPYANASVGANELIVHRDVNVGIAVDLDFEGLLVPVIQGADGQRLRQIARGISDLAARARGKRLQADEILGGTFTITNAGGYGTFVTYPVINQPQVAILSTDGVRKRPVVVELSDGSDAIVAHPVGILALAWDHRAFDGAYASAFLAKVREILETRDWTSEI